VRPNSLDQGQPTQSPALHREIDNHEPGLAPPEQTVSRRHVAGIADVGDAGVLQHAPPRLQHDRMIINDQDGAHVVVFDAAVLPAPFSFARSGITTRKDVPRPRSLSIA